MEQVVTLEVDLGTLRRAIGGGSYVRGTEYARQQAVHRVSWDPEDTALRGSVRGQGGRNYQTAAFFTLTHGQPATFAMGECSCPVEYNCKHVVALVLSALAPGSPGVPATTVSAASGPDAWERSLDSLLGSDRRTTGTKSLAVELALTDGPRLTARLVRMGERGDWVGGNLSWGQLEVRGAFFEYRDAHVRLLRELYVLYRASGGGGYLGYDRSIEFSAINSRELWSLLDEADAAGLWLVREGRGHGSIGYQTGSFCLDVSRGPDGALRMAPRLRTEYGTSTRPIVFIGTEGHGVVCSDESASIRLIRLARPVPPELQRMALADQAVEVPAAEEPKFLDRYYPRLRTAVELVSSDGSFVPPEITGPELVLSARYDDDHRLDLSWAWSYQIGDIPRCAPLAGFGHEKAVRPGEEYRDLAAERALLAGLDLPADAYGLGFNDRLGGSGPMLHANTQLTGADTMRFSTELLPRLSGQPGLRVEVSGTPADYRDSSDDVRIEVSTDELDADPDWFGLAVTIMVAGYEVPFRDLFLALSRGEPLMLLPSGAYFSLNRPELAPLAQLIAEARALQDDPGDPMRISRYQAGFWDELAALGVLGPQAAGWQQQVEGLLAAAADGPDRDPVQPPAGLKAQLRPYQLDGFGWLAFMWKHRLGGILADDMGLGKTLQCLALISHARERDPAAGPFLIVAPTSVVANWTAEAARFTPDLTVVPVTSTMARSKQDLTGLAGGADAVVTSYALLRLDIEAYASVGWAGLLLDEAQQVKNFQSKVYQCARRVKAPVKIAITGTPMENNLMELWSLLSITSPGLFPNPDRFRGYYAQPVERHGDRERLALLRRRIRPLVKRRTKDQVAADLPAKQEQVVAIDLAPAHRRLYQKRLQRERQKVLGLIGDMNGNRFAIFRSLTLLRQLSLHAGLVEAEHADLASAKIDALVGQLREVIAGGHRALVFSQFTRFLGLVRERLEAEDIGYCYLDGSTQDRGAVVQAFKDGTDPVFLISLKAGGFGLNLTEADYCFLLDPWWNPATEAQAVDRTHRIGQTRNVMVYRLVSRDTIEEKVLALQARKARLFTSVMDDGQVFGASLDADDIRALLSS